MNSPIQILSNYQQMFYRLSEKFAQTRLRLCRSGEKFSQTVFYRLFTKYNYGLLFGSVCTLGMTVCNSKNESDVAGKLITLEAKTTLAQTLAPNIKSDDKYNVLKQNVMILISPVNGFIKMADGSIVTAQSYRKMLLDSYLTLHNLKLLQCYNKTHKNGLVTSVSSVDEIKSAIEATVATRKPRTIN